MAKFRLLDIVKRFASLLPEVASPPRPVPFNMKIMFTTVAALLYVFASQIKPAGALDVTGPDPLASVRASIGATRGTLGEFGVLPLLTSAFTLQLLASARLLDVNFGLKEDRALFGSAQKQFALFLSLIYATLLVFSGVYGSPSELGPLPIFGIIAQLVLATFTFNLLDEVLQKGHGLGSGVMLFAGAHACTTAIWGAASLRTLQTPHGPQYEGALPALIQLVFSWHSISRALTEAFWRPHLPSIVAVLSTLVIGAVAAYLGRVRLEFPVKHVRVSSQRGAYPVKLLYTGAMPLLFLGAVRANLLIASYAAAYNFPPSLLVRLVFGAWDKAGTPVSGLAAALAPPTSLVEALWHPLRTIAYVALSIGISAFFSNAWISATGSEAHQVIKQLQEQQLTMLGFREGQMSKELKRAIPTAALLGGAIASAVAVFGDILGAIGGGAGVFIGLTVTQTYVAMGMMESGYADVPGAQMMAESF